MKGSDKSAIHPTRTLRGIFRARSRCYAALFGFGLFFGLIKSTKAETVQLNDHATSPCYLYVNEGRADWTIVHITVVTGTVWMHDNDYYFDVRLRDGSGNRIGLGSAGSMYIPEGTPAGTIVSEFDTQINYPLSSSRPLAK